MKALSSLQPSYEGITGSLSPTAGVCFDWDRNGNLVGLTPPGRPEHELGTLRSTSSPAQDAALFAEYGFDQNGNRTSYTGFWGAVAGVYDNQDRMTRYGGATYTYTANGELLTKNVGADITTYEYDVFGSLREATLPDGTELEYVIDAQQRRIGKKVDGVLVQGLIYQDQLDPVAELDGTGAVVSRFIYGTRPHVPEHLVKSGVTYRIVSDHLGSVRLVVDVTTGTIAQRLDYDEYGRVLQDTNPGFQPFGFAGGIWDADLELVRFGWRDYDPESGRWTAKDPIGFDGGDTNHFAYVGANPVDAADPTGLAQLCARPLADAAGLLSAVYPGWGSSERLSRTNREPLHEQFWFDDGENVGFFGDDSIGPDEKFGRDDYVCRGRQYDDGLLKQAIASNDPNPGGKYSAWNNNCLGWTDRVLHDYERLRMEETLRTGEDPETTFVINKLLRRP